MADLGAQPLKDAQDASASILVESALCCTARDTHQPTVTHKYLSSTADTLLEPWLGAMRGL